MRRLRRHARTVNKTAATATNKRDAAMLFVQNLSVHGGMPVQVDERGIEALISEKYGK